MDMCVGCRELMGGGTGVGTTWWALGRLLSWLEMIFDLTLRGRIDFHQVLGRVGGKA